MGFLKTIWNAVDGHKTQIGAALAFLGRIIAYLGHPELGVPISQVGDGIAALGLTHAVVKAVQ